MTEPTTTPLRMWEREIAPSLPWADVRRQLEEAEVYWLVSVGRRGVPLPRPVWGVWLDDRLLLSVGSTSHWNAIPAHADVAVHLGDPLAVVIVEGRAQRAAGEDGLFQRFVDAYNPKYAWSFDPAEDMVVNGVIEVVPDKVLAWTTVPVEACTPSMTFPTAGGRWTFG
ncbi:MAG TPA: pyridoxamine 5'-phosphate oxidase family protein [Acidimicrobiales bacterium]|nr:pyridoxamine 5'-phosphate oxidase family protein [Acidimicrobiales bacterium]